MVHSRIRLEEVPERCPFSADVLSNPMMQQVCRPGCRTESGQGTSALRDPPFRIQCGKHCGVAPVLLQIGENAGSCISTIFQYEKNEETQVRTLEGAPVMTRVSEPFWGPFLSGLCDHIVTTSFILWHIGIVTSRLKGRIG